MKTTNFKKNNLYLSLNMYRWTVKQNIFFAYPNFSHGTAALELTGLLSVLLKETTVTV